jgi:hypothetical protein
MPPDRVLVAQLAEELVGEPAAVEVVRGEVDAEERCVGRHRELIVVEHLALLRVSGRSEQSEYMLC